MISHSEANGPDPARKDLSSEIVDKTLHDLRRSELCLYYFAGASFALFVLVLIASIATRQSYLAISDVATASFLFWRLMGLTRQVGLLIAVFPLIQLQDNPPADEVRRALLVQINRTPVHKAGLPPSLPQAVIAHYFDPVSWEGPHNDQIWGTRNGRVSGTK